MTGFWLRTLTHVNSNHVNKIEARYKVLRLNVKLSEVLLLRLRATFHTLPLFYLLTKFTHLTWLNFPLTICTSDRLEKSNTSLLGFSLVERKI